MPVYDYNNLVTKIIEAQINIVEMRSELAEFKSQMAETMANNMEEIKSLIFNINSNGAIPTGNRNITDFYFKLM